MDDFLLQVAILHQLDYVWIKQFPWWLYRCFLSNPWTSFTGPQPLFRTQAQGNTDHLFYTKIINIPMIYPFPPIYYFCFSSMIHTSPLENHWCRSLTENNSSRASNWQFSQPYRAMPRTQNLILLAPSPNYYSDWQRALGTSLFPHSYPSVCC